jgi:hypothetical protein
MLAAKSWFDFRKPPPLPPRPRVASDINPKPTIKDELKPTIKNELKPPIEDEVKPTIEDEVKEAIEDEPEPLMAADRDEHSDTETILTETTTTAATSFWDHTAVRDAVPWPGETFIMVERATGRVLSHTKGELRLEDNTSRRGCWHWLCVETDGWFGFCNTASGRHLGVDGNTLLAEAKHHLGCEFFCTKRHPNGGYLLLATKNDWKLLKVGHNKEGNGLVATEDVEGVVWEFVKV